MKSDAVAYLVLALGVLPDNEDVEAAVAGLDRVDRLAPHDVRVQVQSFPDLHVGREKAHVVEVGFDVGLEGDTIALDLQSINAVSRHQACT